MLIHKILKWLFVSILGVGVMLGSLYAESKIPNEPTTDPTSKLVSSMIIKYYSSTTINGILRLNNFHNQHSWYRSNYHVYPKSWEPIHRPTTQIFYP